MKIALDAVGGDLGLAPNIDGAVQAANAYGVGLILVGPAAQIRAELSARGVGAGDARFEVVDAPDLVEMREAPGACRTKPRSSIMVCAELVKSRRAAGMVSAGNSGATVAAALRHFGLLPGVLGPALAVPIPTPTGVSILLDAGAGADCSAENLLQYARMGTLLARRLCGIGSPRVGILTTGEEEGKGNALVADAFPLLKRSGLNFIGAVEGRDVPAGKADVVVCDGFVGNVTVKTLEGTADAVLRLLKIELTAAWRYKLPALALRGPFARLRRKMSYDEYGGAPLVGVDGVAIMCHGSSNARAVARAVRAAAKIVEMEFVSALRQAVEPELVGQGERHEH